MAAAAGLTRRTRIGCARAPRGRDRTTVTTSTLGAFDDSGMLRAFLRGFKDSNSHGNRHWHRRRVGQRQGRSLHQPPRGRPAARAASPRAPASRRRGGSATAARAGSRWRRYARIAGNPKNQAREVLERILDHARPRRRRERRRDGDGGPRARAGAGARASGRVPDRSPAPPSCCCRTSTRCSRSAASTRGTCASTATARTAASASPTTAPTATAPPARARSSTSRPGRLRFRVEDLGRIALATQRAAQIAGRCSVFAKSDMIHAQQRGFTPEEILNGLCDAVARNFRSSITKGRVDQPGTSRWSAAWRTTRASCGRSSGPSAGSRAA